MAVVLVLAARSGWAQQPASDRVLRDLVGISILDAGRAILLATSGIEENGRRWRFRSLDTSDLPQPIRSASLSRSGTKLFIDTGAGARIVDLTKQSRHNERMQYVSPRDLAADGVAPAGMHRLPAQRFLTIQAETLQVVDDVGAVSSSRPIGGAAAALSADGAVLVMDADGAASICSSTAMRREDCRAIGGRVPGPIAGVVAATDSPRDARGASPFLVLNGPLDATRVIDPERPASAGPPLRRAEAALRARLALDGGDLDDAQATLATSGLLSEASAYVGPAHRMDHDWRFFRVVADEALYAPLLQFARRETSFPDRFETLETLGGERVTGSLHEVATALENRYLRLTVAERRERCTIYFRTRSEPGSWVVEYWFYYPFDVGGLGSHLHDPEHLFVEVDKLGGTVRRVIGAGHGYIAGNNIYSADAPGALPVELPLYAMVELGKHASAADIDGDGIFTPGLDENEYRERAKIWGVRDVIGTINNQLIAYDRTMSALRFDEDVLAPVATPARFPEKAGLGAKACCALEPLPAGDPDLPICRAPTTDCARRSVLSHPDARDPATILKEWVFPHAFLRAVYGLGPRQRLNSAGFGYVVDLYRMPGLGHIMPMPGRVTGEIYGWRQDRSVEDPDSCLADCTRDTGVGVGVGYEQFMSNLFGIYSSVRVYSPPVTDIWITFGPMVEVPVVNRTNLNFKVGLSFRPYASPRFEMKLSLGLWKPRTRQFGIPAGQ